MYRGAFAIIMSTVTRIGAACGESDLERVGIRSERPRGDLWRDGAIDGAGR